MNEDVKKGRIELISSAYSWLILTICISALVIIYHVGFVREMYFLVFYILMLVIAFMYNRDALETTKDQTKANFFFVVVGFLLLYFSQSLWEYRNLKMIGGIKLHYLGIVHILAYIMLSLAKLAYSISDSYKNSLLGLWIKAKKKQLRKEIDSSDNKKDE
tara:strand:+ start:1744 stop:2223 length:480 start_codon:yes stop_codon:yes gene_type:complete